MMPSPLIKGKRSHYYWGAGECPGCRTPKGEMHADDCPTPYAGISGGTGAGLYGIDLGDLEMREVRYDMVRRSLGTARLLGLNDRATARLLVDSEDAAIIGIIENRKYREGEQ